MTDMSDPPQQELDDSLYSKSFSRLLHTELQCLHGYVGGLLLYKGAEYRDPVTVGPDNSSEMFSWVF